MISRRIRWLAPGTWFPSLVSVGALAILFARSVPAGEPASPWRLDGRVGIELDAHGERLGGDAVLATGAGGEDVLATLDSLRFRDEALRPGLLGQLTAESGAFGGLRVDGLVRVDRARTRGDLESAVTFRPGRLRLSVLDRVEGEVGSGTTGGLVHAITVGVARELDERGLELSARATEERSWAGDDSLEHLLGYRDFRPSVQLLWPIDLQTELLVALERSRRWSRGASSARGARGEIELTRLSGRYRLDRASLFAEGRAYLSGDSLFPSETRWGGAAELERSFLRPLALRVNAEAEQAAYERDSSIFADHLEATLRVAGVLDPEVAGGCEVRLEGVRGIVRHRHDRDRDSDRYGVALGLARAPDRPDWFDLSAEYGRRDFRGDGTGGGVDYDGWTLALEGGDHVYFTASAVGTVLLPHGLRVDLFGHWEREWHTDPVDDIELWIGDLALTRSF